MPKPRTITAIESSHKRTQELRAKLDAKLGRKKVTIGKTTNGEPISNWQKKKNNWILGRL